MHFVQEMKATDDVMYIIELKERIVNPNPINMAAIDFESIKSPRKIMKLAKEARVELLKSKE